MEDSYDVVVLGGGLAGLATAYRLRALRVCVLDAFAHVGGRTRSKRYAEGIWANYAAQYLSPDKVRLFALADELGLPLESVHLADVGLRGARDLSERERADIAAVAARIEDEQRNPRPPTDPDLDDRTFAEWMGSVPEHVSRHYRHWCYSLMCAPPEETSLYGALLLWGDQRTAAFTTEPVPRSNRGDCVFKNGTNELTKALLAASGATLARSTVVESVRREGARYRIQARDAEAVRVLDAEQVVCALPAPVAAAVIADLPEWKRSALLAIAYGRFLATPIALAPRGYRGATYPCTWSRSGPRYNSNDFELRTPGDMETDGGCFHSYLYDCYAREVWDDPDASIKTGAVQALLEEFPEYAGRVMDVDIARWRYGLPVYSPGRMKRQAALEASVDGIHFAGDYVFRSNMEGAVQSADAAAARVLDGSAR